MNAVANEAHLPPGEVDVKRSVELTTQNVQRANDVLNFGELRHLRSLSLHACRVNRAVPLHDLNSNFLTERLRLEHAQQQQNNHYDQQQAQTAARTIPPSAAVRPRRHGPQEQEDENDEQDQTHCRPLRG